MFSPIRSLIVEDEFAMEEVKTYERRIVMARKMVKVPASGKAARARQKEEAKGRKGKGK